MKSVKLALEFKGERDYVHGTDLFNRMNLALIRDFGMRDVRDLSLSIHRMTGSNLILSLLQRDEEPVEQRPIARMAFHNESRAWKLIATEDETVVTARKSYNEEPVQRAAIFNRDRSALRVEERLDYSDIELWVSQNKRLLQLMYPERTGQWLFVRGEFSRYTHTSTYGYSELRLLHNFNFRLTKSEITVDGISCGFIYFSMM
jgi:hypothetical protein